MIGGGAKTRSGFPVRQLAAVAALLALGASGCSPTYYRLQADCDAGHLIQRKAQDPRWSLDDYHIYPDQRSRMFDPSPPDCEPMPPDDPAAHKLMNCVDCKRGSPCWYKNGTTRYVDNPYWMAFLPTGEDGRIRLDLRGAVDVALINSPQFQQQFEELYLSALDVSFERFRFDTQFFAGYQAFFTSDGPQRAGGPSSQLDLSTRNVQMSKMFAAGGELVVGLANSLIWEFSGPDRHTAFTLLDFSFVQPLLRGGGRQRVLERLTVSERTLLANVRQMERFRKGFYTEIAAGVGAGQGPTRRGGLQGGAGLEGFTGVGAGGFGRLGNIGVGPRAGTGAEQAGGFLGLLQTLQQLRNQQINISALRTSLASVQALYDAGGRIDFFQVELARQALYNAQSRLLTSTAAYESSLDAYKINLGLPPDTPIVIDDPLLDRFDLVDSALTETQQFAERLLNEVRDPDLQIDQPRWEDFLARADQLVDRASERLESVSRDLQTLAKNLPARRATLRRLADYSEVDQGDVDPAAYDVKRLDQRADRLAANYRKLVEDRAEIARQLKTLHSVDQRNRLVMLLGQLTLQLNDILLLQAGARLDAVVLTPVNMTSEEAVEIASSYRLDWMNARTSLVDTWRLIEFNANDLKSELDIVFEGDISNTGDNPIRLSGDTGRLRAGIEFDAPLTRLAERNRYRQALIEYQQARRNYYTYVDRVSQGLRDTLRTIRLNELNFELRRASVQLAISQVELARLQLEEPPKPGVEAEGGSDNRVQNLVGALTELLNSQNDFLSVWVNYEVQRLSLSFNLGTMLLDGHGQWIDPGRIEASHYRKDLDQQPAQPRGEFPAPEEIPAPPAEVSY